MPEQGSLVDSGAAETQPPARLCPAGEQAAGITRGHGAVPRGARLWGSLGTQRGSQHPQRGASLGAGTDTDIPPPSALLFLTPDHHTALRGSGTAPGVTLAPPLPYTAPSPFPAALKPDAFTVWAPAHLAAWVRWQVLHISLTPQHLCKETAPRVQPCPFSPQFSSCQCQGN